MPALIYLPGLIDGCVAAGLDLPCMGIGVLVFTVHVSFGPRAPDRQVPLVPPSCKQSDGSGSFLERWIKGAQALQGYRFCNSTAALGTNWGNACWATLGLLHSMD